MENNILINCHKPLNHCWTSENSISVYNCVFPNSIKKKGAVSINDVKWSTSMTGDEFMRRFTKTSFENNDVDDPKSTHLTAQYCLVQTFELLWHLSELMFIQVSPTGHLAYNLCCWFHAQSQESINSARCLIENFSKKQNLLNASVAQNETFWPTVLGLVLQARTSDAASLLSFHPNTNSRGFRSLRLLLTAMPIVSKGKYDGTWNESGAQFYRAWNYWQSECSHRLLSGEFDHVGGDSESVDYINLILKILSGHTDVWDNANILDVTRGPRGWYFRFVSFVFYTNQFVVVEGLATSLDRWLSLYPNNKTNQYTQMDCTMNDLVASAFRLDLFSFIRISSEQLNNWWFVAHFTNLMNLMYPEVLHDFQCDNIHRKSLCQNMDKYSSSNDAIGGTDEKNLTVSNFFLLGYVESLVSETSFLSIVLGYLDFCKTKMSSQILSTLLIRHGIPFSTRASNWFISQAKTRRLHSTAEQLALLTCKRLLPLVSKSATSLTVQKSIKSSSINDNINNNNNTKCNPEFLPSCVTIGWALMSRNYLIVNRIAELALARDCGVILSSFKENNHENTKAELGLESSNEVAELAAIILGFSKETHPDFKQLNHVGKIDPNDVDNQNNQQQLSFTNMSSELAFLIRYAELQHFLTDRTQSVESVVDRLIDLLICKSITQSGHESNSLSAGVNQPDINNNNSFTLSSVNVSVQLRLRLLTEVLHLIGSGRLRRDQIELLITAVIDLRTDVDSSSSLTDNASNIHSLLTEIHVALAKELGKTMFKGMGAVQPMNA